MPGKKRPELAACALQAVEPVTGGLPTGKEKFLRRSLVSVCAELAEAGLDLSPSTLSRLLEEQGFRLRVNAKRYAGPPHPDRERQFEYLEEQKEEFFQADHPVVSVDAKKKELIGNFAQAGRAWGRAAERVNDHDFAKDALGRAVPYGIYDVLNNHGFVMVGSSADTPAFAVHAIKAWWVRFGSKRYRLAKRLLLLADAGGSSGCRPWCWKLALQQEVADRYGLEVTVCHYPTGASKYNPIEHRLFGPISTNWAGQPLRSFERMVELIRGTRTQTGLEVEAVLDQNTWPKGQKVSQAQRADLRLIRHEICPQWNYTIYPRRLHLLN